MKYLKKLSKSVKAGAATDEGMMNKEPKKVVVPGGATERLKEARKIMNTEY